MRNPGGQLTMENRDGSITEFDTFTCSHCNMFRKVPVGQAPADTGGFCTMCSKAICATCDEARHRSLAPSGHCAVFERQLDAMERRKNLRDIIGYDPRDYRAFGQ